MNQIENDIDKNPYISVYFRLAKYEFITYCECVPTKGLHMTEEDKLLTTKEVAEYLGIAENTICQYRMTGIGPRYIKLGRMVRYRLNDVIEWIDKKMKEKEDSEN